MLIYKHALFTKIKKKSTPNIFTLIYAAYIQRRSAPRQKLLKKNLCCLIYFDTPVPRNFASSLL